VVLNRSLLRRKIGLLTGILLAGGAITPTVLAVAPAASAHVTAGRGHEFGGRWVTTWAASPQEAMPGTPSATGFGDQTVRNIIFTSAGGDTARVQLTNTFGTRPLAVGDVTVALAGTGASVVPGTVHQVTFGGSSSIKIPIGAQVLSDPVRMRVPALADLAVSVYLPHATGPATNHSDAQQVNWVAAGDHAADQDAGAFTTQVQSWYFVDDVTVAADRAFGTLVTFGDSITDGLNSTVGANARWPNDLARRLDALHHATLSVADEGISGNRVLTNSECCGVNALARLQRDVLGQTGVRDVILLEGINDFGFSVLPPNPAYNPTTNVTAQQVIAGYQQIISYAHAQGLKIFGATLTPFKGAGYYSAAGEKKREAVNTWIRTSGAFDGVIDFDKVVRDPSDPLMMNPAFDSGDHLHPNDAGYQAMANAINLQMLFQHPLMVATVEPSRTTVPVNDITFANEPAAGKVNVMVPSPTFPVKGPKSPAP
jgi:lysophospholipase L1-like esterase